MDFYGIDSALSAVQANPSTNTLSGAVSMQLLADSLDNSEQMGNNMVKMMENYVTPYLGSNIDTYV